MKQESNSVLEAVRGEATPRTVARSAPARNLLLQVAVGFALLAVLAAGAVVYWVASDEPARVGVGPLPTTDRSHEEILQDLINRGLIPSQSVEPAPRNQDEMIRDLINRGLIPAQTLGPDPVVLNAGPSDSLNSCFTFSPEQLSRVTDIAFAGTVTAFGEGTVTLNVDSWYRGGDAAAKVVLNAPAGMEALIGGIPFATGAQYLISAQGGNVNYCGFSGPASPAHLVSFNQAFPQS